MMERKLIFSLILSGVLVLGCLFSLHSISAKDADMRSSLETNARLAITGVNISQVPALTGTAADLTSPVYQELRSQMIDIAAVHPLGRYAYLLRMNPDGSVIFLVDSGKEGTDGFSPPGQVYTEASPEVISSFLIGKDMNEGPSADRWGSFVSGLIPLKDARTGKVFAVFGLDLSAEGWDAKIMESALIPVLLTLLVVMIIIFFFVLQIRLEENHNRVVSSEERLKRSEQQLLKAQNNARLGLFEYHAESGIIHPSPMANEIIGLEPDEENLIPSRYEVALHPDDREFVRHIHQKSLDQQKSYTVAYRVMHNDGSIRWVQEIGEFQAYPDRDGSWLSGTIQDITSLKEAQESFRQNEERLQLMIRNSNDIIMVLDKDLVKTYVSDTVERITGFPVFEFQSRPINPLMIHPDDFPDVMKALETLCRTPGSHMRVLYRHRHKSGGYIYLETIGTNLLEDPVIKGIILNCRDFTKIKEAEERLVASLEELRIRNSDLESIQNELTMLNDSLENRVLERTRDLIESKEQIERLLEQKDQFIYQLAHDLRTPLTPVVAMLPLLIIGIQDPDAKSLLEIFNKSISYLQKMVEDVLYYSQLNRQYSISDYADYHLIDLMNDALHFNAFPAEEKEITIEMQVPDDLMIRLSKSQANQIFRNLINNAVKFNAFRGKITIEATADKKWISVVISDTGMGIPEDRIDEIWDEFTTGDAARKDPMSKGMGLPIVRQIVALHEGTIEVFSKGTGKGTTFTLRFPVRKTAEDT